MGSVMSHVKPGSDFWGTHFCPTRSSRYRFFTVAARKSLLSRAREQAVTKWRGQDAWIAL
jgi:hypothetical protein